MDKKQRYWFKNQALKALSYIICTNCAASAWFLNQDLGFFERVLGLQVSRETGESAQPLTTAITDQLMTQ